MPDLCILVRLARTCWDLTVPVGVGDEGVAAMVSGCKRLKKVVLSYCKSITDASLRSLASLRDLQTLELRVCKQVTSIGFFHNAASCTHLRELDVSDCSLVGIFAVLRMSKLAADQPCAYGSDRRGDDGSGKYAVFAGYGSGLYGSESYEGFNRWPCQGCPDMRELEIFDDQVNFTFRCDFASEESGNQIALAE